MRRTTAATLTACLIATALAATVPSGADAEDPVATPIVAGPLGFFSPGQYATPVAVTEAGAEMTFLNLDAALHDVVSVEVGSDDQPWCDGYAVGRCPLIWTPLIPLAQSRIILGTDNLQAEEIYEFFCSIHAWMRGVIVVLPE